MSPADHQALQPVTYAVDQKRIRRVVRPGLRKTLGRVWWAHWAWLFLFCAFPLTMSVARETIYQRDFPLARASGLAIGTLLNGVIWGAIAIFIAGLLVLSRSARQELHERVGTALRSTASPSTAAMIDYTLTWPGIYDVQRQRDGVVLVHGGSLFFFIPDNAFASKSNRAAFLDYLERGLTPDARARSAKEFARARQT